MTSNEAGKLVTAIDVLVQRVDKLVERQAEASTSVAASQVELVKIAGRLAPAPRDVNAALQERVKLMKTAVRRP
jgi:hypothetical protein